MHRKIVTAVLATAFAGVASTAAATASGAAPQAATAPGAMVMPAHHPGSEPGSEPTTLAQQLAAARVATARFALDLNAAKRAGYQIITPMMPDMGFHFLNSGITGFDVRRPHILVYEHTRHGWQLGALEWVFPQTPDTPPLEGATYGSFAAACHYRDGTFVFTAAQADCAPRSPTTHSPFNFWHPDLVTLHVWLWYPNPDGLYHGTNPFITPFNAAA
jgi:hypothetical protein